MCENSPTQEDERPYYKFLNIGYSSSVRLMDFIGEMENTLGKKAEKRMYPMQPRDVKQTYTNTKYLEEQIGYKPKVSLKEGVQCFIKWQTIQN